MLPFSREGKDHRDDSAKGGVDRGAATACRGPNLRPLGESRRVNPGTRRDRRPVRLPGPRDHLPVTGWGGGPHDSWSRRRRPGRGRHAEERSAHAWAAAAHRRPVREQARVNPGPGAQGDVPRVAGPVSVGLVHCPGRPLGVAFGVSGVTQTANESLRLGPPTTLRMGTCQALLLGVVCETPTVLAFVPAKASPAILCPRTVCRREKEAVMLSRVSTQSIPILSVFAPTLHVRAHDDEEHWVV